MSEPTVRQLRVVLTVADLDAAIAFYRDALGLREQDAFSDPDGRVVILEAGRATLELSDEPHARFIDEVEGVAAGDPPRVRLAFEVEDGAGSTQRLAASGTLVVAPPVRTPWDSLNARLAGPEGMPVTLFEELPPSG
ncbi:VOC family protein [Cellulomonas edaphi]|uniref:VOC family protein n=1 Tax=Cellulomonas edaphi TaxID=3053468 RepID=A0ABT7S4A3_9CELL|nr:VOC family protein [Cellulomons edaphi]MDM7830455.1 VOC family protein [Cellulomons edaphi]